MNDKYGFHLETEQDANTGKQIQVKVTDAPRPEHWNGWMKHCYKCGGKRVYLVWDYNNGWDQCAECGDRLS